MQTHKDQNVRKAVIFSSSLIVFETWSPALMDQIDGV
jgi:hypothetical protein